LHVLECSHGCVASLLLVSWLALLCVRWGLFRWLYLLGFLYCGLKIKKFLITIFLADSITTAFTSCEVGGECFHCREYHSQCASAKSPWLQPRCVQWRPIQKILTSIHIFWWIWYNVPPVDQVPVTGTVFHFLYWNLPWRVMSTQPTGRYAVMQFRRVMKWELRCAGPMRTALIMGQECIQDSQKQEIFRKLSGNECCFANTPGQKYMSFPSINVTCLQALTNWNFGSGWKTDNCWFVLH